MVGEITTIVLNLVLVGGLGTIYYKLGRVETHIKTHCDFNKRVEARLWPNTSHDD